MTADHRTTPAHDHDAHPTGCTSSEGRPMKITVELSEEDAAVLGAGALGSSPGMVAIQVHELVRHECRRLGAPGATAVEYEEGGQVHREEAIPPGLLSSRIVGPVTS